MTFTADAPSGENPTPTHGQEEYVKVTDRKGVVKYLPRSEFESRKRSRKRRDPMKSFPLREILSVIFIIILIILTSLLALKFVQ